MVDKLSAKGHRKNYPKRACAVVLRTLSRQGFSLYLPRRMAQQAQLRVPSPELARDLGASHATAVVVGTIIGSGIFLVPAEMMQAAGTAKLVYLAWLVGGLLSFFGALTYAELGAMKPQAGGEYVYVRDAYGPLGGFLDAWTWFVIAKPASVATIATGLVRILGTFPIFSFFTANAISVPFGVRSEELT